jgi:hypothetical protein
VGTAPRTDAAPASTAPPLALKVDGQVVGSGIREVVVSLYNTDDVAHDIELSIELPNAVLLPGAINTGTVVFAIPSVAGERTQIRASQKLLAPHDRAIARVPIANLMASARFEAWLLEDPSRRLTDERELQLSR